VRIERIVVKAVPGAIKDPARERGLNRRLVTDLTHEAWTERVAKTRDGLLVTACGIVARVAKGGEAKALEAAAEHAKNCPSCKTYPDPPSTRTQYVYEEEGEDLEGEDAEEES
jgi:hypothetical protein